MTVRTVSDLLSELSTGGSADNTIETRLVVDIIDTLNSLVGDGLTTADVSAAIAAALVADPIIILPVADPEIAGALWNNSGTITVSAGA